MEFLRLGGALLRFIKWIMCLLHFFNIRTEKKKVARLNDPLLELSATALAEKIRKKEITSEQVVRAYIKRISDVNVVVNAVVEERFLTATYEAEEADLYIRNHPSEDLEFTKPLLGVPITVKESCKVKGMSLSVGTISRIKEKALEDSAIVARLKSAGAVILCVTNTPEFCLGLESYNFVTGRTCNPYNNHFTCGGGSGGEGALLGAGASVVGIGTDVTGSIRIPAMFNGVFGHKPTPRLISIEGHFPISTDSKIEDYLSICPITRYAEDLPLMMEVMVEGASDRLKLDSKVDFKDLTVYFQDELERTIMLAPVDREIKDCIEKAAAYLKTCGCEVSDFKFDLAKTTEMSISILFKLEDIPNVLKYSISKAFQGEDNLWLELIKSVFRISSYTFQILFFNAVHRFNGLVPKVKYREYVQMARDMKKFLLVKLRDDGVLLFPTFPTSAFPHNQATLHITSVAYVMLFNVLGMPSCHVPMGLDQNNLPIGIQVVAAPFQDRLCFAVAKKLEEHFGGWTSPSG